MAYTFTFGIVLAEDDTGLTLRGQLVDSAGADVGATFTAGFVEVGAGSYLLTTSIPDDHRGGVVVMDDSDGSELAFGCINPEQGEHVDVAVSTRAVAGDAMALTGAERTTLTAAIWAALTSGLTTVGSVGKRIADYLDAAVSSLIGSGAVTVTVTVTDGTDPLEGVPVTIRDQAEAARVAGPINTDASGEAVFYLDDATAYRAIPRTTLFLTGGAQNFTTAGATAVTCTMTRAALPTPTDADCYLLHNQERRIEGDVAYAGIEVYVQDLHWYGRQDAAADAIRSPIGTTYTADADGLWSFEIAKAAFDAGAVLTLVRTRWMADATTQTETINAVLDADAADDEDRVALADLKLTRT